MLLSSAPVPIRPASQVARVMSAVPSRAPAPRIALGTWPSRSRARPLRPATPPNPRISQSDPRAAAGRAMPMPWGGYALFRLPLALASSAAEASGT